MASGPREFRFVQTNPAPSAGQNGSGPTQTTKPQRRSSKACELCRRRKVRCSGTNPCLSCAMAGNTCVYENSRKRKLSIVSQASNHQSTISTTTIESPHAIPSHTSKNLSIPYFRYFGPTAIAPGGFKQLKFKLSSPKQVNRRISDLNATQARVFQREIPKRHIRAFFEHMGSLFPFLQEEEVLQRMQDGTASQVLLNAIAALGARLNQSNEDFSTSETYADAAKGLALPILSLPNLDLVISLLLLAYHEFGMDRDSGLWMWCGMACRMATDIGLHKTFDAANATQTGMTAELRSKVFWSVFHLDRFICSGTGRVTTIQASEIELPLPDNGESLFAQLTRIVLLQGMASDLINGKAATKGRYGSCQVVRSNETLADLQSELRQFQKQLPMKMAFNVDNFRYYANKGQSQVYLLVHAWFHSFIIQLHCPELLMLQPATSRSTFSDANYEPNLEYSRSSARSISDMIAFADLIKPESYLSNPFVSQPLLIAASASLFESRSISDKQTAGDFANWSICRRNVGVCKEALLKMHKTWNGTSWLSTTLNSREAQEPDVDLTESGSAAANTADVGMLRHWNRASGSRGDNLTSLLGLSLSGNMNDPEHSTISVLQSGSRSRQDSADQEDRQVMQTNVANSNDETQFVTFPFPNSSQRWEVGINDRWAENILSDAQSVDQILALIQTAPFQQ